MIQRQLWWRRLVQQQEMLLVVLALLAGVGGAVLGSRYLADRAAASEAEVARRYASREVVVAATDLPRGAVLAPASLAARSMPQDFLPADAVPVARAAELLGTQTAIAIRRGTPVVGAAVRADEGTRALSSLLAASERALTIAVDDTSSQAGALRPGDRIDLFYATGVSGDSLLVPLLQDVQILATGTSVSAEQAIPDDLPKPFATITLRVAAASVSRILLAQQAGQITMVLRAPGDGELLDAAVRNSRDLLRTDPPRSARPRHAVELLVGGNGRSPQRSWLQVGAASAAGETT